MAQVVDRHAGRSPRVSRPTGGARLVFAAARRRLALADPDRTGETHVVIRRFVAAAPALLLALAGCSATDSADLDRLLPAAASAE